MLSAEQPHEPPWHPLLRRVTLSARLRAAGLRRAGAVRRCRWAMRGRPPIYDGARARSCSEDSQRLAEVFEPRGPGGPHALHRRARAACRSPASACCCSPMPSSRPLAGNLPAWPRRDAGRARQLHHAGRTGPSAHHGDAGAAPRCPAATTCWSGATSARSRPLERRFWYGLAAAVAVLIVAGVVGALLIRRAAAGPHPQHPPDRVRDHARRPQPPAARRGSGGDELDTLVADHQPHARADRAAGARHRQRLQLHRARPAHAARRAALAARGAVPHPARRRRGVRGNRRARWPTSTASSASSMPCCGSPRSTPACAARASCRWICASCRAAAVEFYVPAAELKGITLSLPRRSRHPACARGDPVLLAQARQQPHRQFAEVRPRAAARSTVRDRASGGRTRRYRGRRQRSGHDRRRDRPGPPSASSAATPAAARPGVGLGLSLVEAVARLHGGSLEFAEQQRGLTAIINFPSKA